MGRAVGVSLGWIARVGALVSCAALIGCSSADKLTGRNSKYSPKVVEDGDPVPKGGGVYKLGGAYTLNGRTYYPTANSAYRAEGIASWYGADFHGRLTANGEAYDMHAVSAAHPTMPLPSYARVTNLDNGRSIIVRVNDRGPYAHNRVIDLSVGTAKALDMYSRGLARVRVEYVGPASLDGSDDRMLMATLRHGAPAPAPSRVMVASAKPFVPDFGDAQGRDSGLLVPPERPFGLGTSTARAAAPRPMPEPPSTRPPARSPVTTANLPQPASAAQPTTATSAFAPVRSDGSLGLMSGRGLY